MKIIITESQYELLNEQLYKQIGNLFKSSPKIVKPISKIVKGGSKLSPENINKLVDKYIELVTSGEIVKSSEIKNLMTKKIVPEEYFDDLVEKRKLLNKSSKVTTKIIKNYAPQGVLFMPNNKILIGDDHYTAVELSQDLIDQIKPIAKKFGYYGEGIGIEHNKGVMSSKIYDDLTKNGSEYKGSWDEKVIIPEEINYSYLSTFFSNPIQNNRLATMLSMVKKDETIFQLLSRPEVMVKYTEPGLNLKPKDLERFLKEISEYNVNFLALSKKPANKETLKDFIDKGEALMWGDAKGWITLPTSPTNPTSKVIHYSDYSTKAGQMARKETKVRDEFLINDAPPGVYFIGSGHINDIKKMMGDKARQIDGSNINNAAKVD